MRVPWPLLLSGLVSWSDAFAPSFGLSSSVAMRLQFSTRPRVSCTVGMARKSQGCLTGERIDSSQSLGQSLSSLMLAITFATAISPAVAYSPSDYASDAVLSAIQSVKESSGDIKQTFKSYEAIASIITEGRGVGGIINYKGVQLDRGYIADEDTSIYNPGLTLLTESEKERLVEAVVQSRKAGLSQGQWSSENQLAYEFLRGKLDPLHVTELRGYLAIFPFYTAIIYMAALAVQQFARNLFPVVYLVGVAAIVAPILLLVAAGP